ncbi:MAG: PAS domain S-box protein [Firmicutes bacterium]|nr:PAS domain S-box protein [Bacillota bacterium]
MSLRNDLAGLPKAPRVLIAIFTILAVGIGFAGYHLYKIQRDAFIENKKNELLAIADLKASQIANWRKERLGDAAVIFENTSIAARAGQYLQDQAAAGPRDVLLAWMSSLHKNYSYESILLLDRRGEIRLSIPEKGEVAGPTAKMLAEEALRLKRPVLSDFYRSEYFGLTRISLVVPIILSHNDAAEPAGVFLLRIDPYNILFPLIQWWPTPDQTAGNELVSRKGDELVHFNDPLRQLDEAVYLRLTDGPGGEAGPSGREKAVFVPDNRGRPVLAAARPVPGSTWFLIAKADAEEIFAPLTERAWTTAIITGMLILLAGAGTVSIWRRQEDRFFRKQREAEQERRALARHYEYLTRYANDMIILFDENRNIVEANERAAQSYGYTRGEMLQLKAEFLRSPEARPDPDQEPKALEQADGLVYETFHRRKDGSPFPVEVSLRTIEIEGKKFYQSIIRDITERKRLEEALRRSEEYYRSLIENTLDIITILDIDGNILYESPSVKRVLGYKPEELAGKRVYDYIHPDDRHLALDTMAKTLKNPGTFLRLELRFRHQNGRWRVLECLVNNLLDHYSIAGIVVYSRDVTRRKEMEEEIKALNEELERRVAERTRQLEAANRELEAFCYSVSHDLRAPLRSADGFSQALWEDYYDRLDEQGRDYLQRIRAASRRMGRLIDDLLDLSRVTRCEIFREKVDLSAMAQSIAEELKRTEPERQADFVITPGVTAEADPRLLRVVMENLLGNAWKFTGKHPRARIEFGVTEERGETVYYIRDDGAGFDRAYAGKLFGAFQRLHRMDEFPGTGVGLATVQRIIHRHGGRVWAEGAVEQGATFYFTL